MHMGASIHIHTCVYIYIYIYMYVYIGGWGGESFVRPPTGKSFRFVRACERSEARRSCVGADWHG